MAEIDNQDIWVGHYVNVLGGSLIINIYTHNSLLGIWHVFGGCLMINIYIHCCLDGESIFGVCLTTNIYTYHIKVKVYLGVVSKY